MEEASATRPPAITRVSRGRGARQERDGNVERIERCRTKRLNQRRWLARAAGATRAAEPDGADAAGRRGRVAGGSDRKCLEGRTLRGQRVRLPARVPGLWQVRRLILQGSFLRRLIKAR
eukprot:1959303-Pyramimonas_sp.AAC.1